MSKQDKSVCVLGLGYVGLPTAAVLASRGYQVHGVEVNPAAAEIINSGRAHIVEPELDILVRAAVESGRLKAHAKPTEADVFLLCVPTPMTEAHEPDLSYVRAATLSICPFVRDGALVVLESTSPPGTTELVAQIIAENTPVPHPRVLVAHAPERVLPGRVLREVVENDRVVGGIDAASTKACVEFYSTFVSGAIHPTSARMAETVKLVENAYRDVNVAFANELSLISDELKLDVWELISLANKHPRVDILSPGSGVGGHCIAVDPWFIVHKTPDQARLIRAAREVNDHKPDWIVERVKQRSARFKNARIACLGLAYKPDIDDLRESPAVHIVKRLLSELSADIRVVEPHLHSHPEFNLVPTEQAIEDADIVVFLVAHKAFKSLPANLLAEKTIIDPSGTLR
jgi:UDP-N-acetyl-D-mannosaminuronic acid dehydrogenase